LLVNPEKIQRAGPEGSLFLKSYMKYQVKL